MLPTPKQMQARNDNHIQRCLDAALLSVMRDLSYPSLLVNRIRDLRDDVVDENKRRTKRRQEQK